LSHFDLPKTLYLHLAQADSFSSAFIEFEKSPFLAQELFARFLQIAGTLRVETGEHHQRLTTFFASDSLYNDKANYVGISVSLNREVSLPQKTDHGI